LCGFASVLELDVSHARAVVDRKRENVAGAGGVAVRESHAMQHEPRSVTGWAFCGAPQNIVLEEGDCVGRDGAADCGFEGR